MITISVKQDMPDTINSDSSAYALDQTIKVCEEATSDQAIDAFVKALLTEGYLPCSIARGLAIAADYYADWDTMEGEN